jgi:hypothetical protein
VSLLVWRCGRLGDRRGFEFGQLCVYPRISIIILVGNCNTMKQTGKNREVRFIIWDERNSTQFRCCTANLRHLILRSPEYHIYVPE